MLLCAVLDHSPHKETLYKKSAQMMSKLMYIFSPNIFNVLLTTVV